MKKSFLFSVLVLLFSFSLIIKSSTVNVNANQSLNIQAKSAYLMDANSGTLIYAKNENLRLPIASMTKIMLLLLAFEKQHNGDLSFEDSITVSQSASSMGGSQVFLQANKTYKIDDLIKSITIASANDASVALAEHLFGSEEQAVQAMNEKAHALKLNDTLFSNCTGLMKPTQYSCAKDVAIMLSELIKYPKYFEYSTIYLDELVHPDGQITTLTNTNKLVKFYNGCDGGKTGFTNEAGFCLAATAKRGTTRIISVVINEKDSKQRFADCSEMFNFAFDNFCSKEILSSKRDFDIKAKVNEGKKEYVAIRPDQDFYLFGKKNVKEKISVDFIPNSSIRAPLKNGEIVGKLIIFKDNVQIGERNAVCAEEINKLSYFDYVKKIAVA